MCFHKVLGQGSNWEIVSAFELNYGLDLAIALFLFVYQFMYLRRLCSLGSTRGGVSSYLFTLQKRC